MCAIEFFLATETHKQKKGEGHIIFLTWLASHCSTKERHWFYKLDWPVQLGTEHQFDLVKIPKTGKKTEDCDQSRFFDHTYF